MGYIVKRSGNYRVRYRDPVGKMRSEPRGDDPDGLVEGVLVAGAPAGAVNPGDIRA